MSSIIIENNELFTINSSNTIVLNCNQININYELINGDYRILIFNNYDGDIVVNETGIINNANVEINYLQLDKYNLKQNTKIDVNKNSNLNIFTTYLATNNKNIVFDLFNKESDSSVNINNNVVCLDNADFSLDCIGTIVKGAKRSKCHQSSHCLTIDKPKRARILPVLNIDENDVEASHSLSSGTIDQEVLFYMNSRGLNKKEALNLIVKSYLMPDDDFYLNFDDGKLIQERAISKVDQICSM